MNKRAIGAIFEDKACAYLKDKGFKILHRNVRYKFGEIDIVALFRRTLVFVEVKGGSGFIPPRLRINEKKLRSIEMAANMYTKSLDHEYESYRLDVIEVLDNGEVNHIEGVGKW
ncbi:MAG TPA: YraN family protein [Kosmotogaceae bacterium]|nr:MAG: hypothetical protein XE05_0103 [Thermotogales bacterium 46_20]HAA85485.1 YraN family protein [Kosmotogaceae bacterium]